MDLEEARDLAENLMYEHGLIDEGWALGWSRARRSMGDCCGEDEVIRLSAVLVPHATEEQVRATIMHEIAHALVGVGHGHDAVWKQKMIDLGQPPNRLGSWRSLPRRWVGKCPRCEDEWKRDRRLRRAACGSCLAEVGRARRDECLIEWTSNPEHEALAS